MMTFIRLYQQNDGCEIPAGAEYLLVVSEEIDAQGNWIPRHVESIKNEGELRTVLRTLHESGEGFVIRCSHRLWGVVAKMGIPMLQSEWGVL